MIGSLRIMRLLNRPMNAPVTVLVSAFWPSIEGEEQVLAQAERKSHEDPRHDAVLDGEEKQRDNEQVEA